MKRWLWGGTGVVVLGLALWSFAGGSGLLSRSQAAPSDANATAAAQDRLIVHEWGTFTSYSGSDGGRLEFRPLFDDDLPGFVQDRSTASGSGLFSKLNYRALVRMETPVTYFYTEQPRDVRVKVNFPQGLLTEFYPPVASISPAYNQSTETKAKNSSLDWGTVHLIPESQLRPQIKDDRLALEVQKRTAAALPPHADYNNHYGYARQTDSALVHIHRPADPKNPFVEQGDHFEKFLFYRGIGDFKLPIKVQALGKGQALVNNSGTDPIGWLMLLDNTAGGIRYATFDGVAAGQQREVALPADFAEPAKLAEDLTLALVGTGLYRREAEAMVNTWKSSWFGEEGTRLLYFVPQKLTDELLPLTIDPKPAESVRVLVGRLDLMTPEQEATVTQIVKESAAARKAAIEKVREARDEGREAQLDYPVPEAVRKLGRLADPALTRVRHVSTDANLSWEAAALIRELQAAAGK